MQKTLIVGLGTGRCGTLTLADLLNRQRGAEVTHERNWRRMDWAGSTRQVSDLFDKLERRMSKTGLQLAGDVAMYYLPYADFIARRYDNVRFVCLRRDKEGTVNSFLRCIPGRNPWINHDGEAFVPGRFDKCLPTIGIPDPRRAAERYWDDYYATAEELARTHGDLFRIFETEALNSAAGQRDILTHVGFDKSQQILDVGRYKNEQFHPREVVSTTRLARAGRRLREQWGKLRGQRQT